MDYRFQIKTFICACVLAMTALSGCSTSARNTAQADDVMDPAAQPPVISASSSITDREIRAKLQEISDNGECLTQIIEPENQLKDYTVRILLCENLNYEKEPDQEYWCSEESWWSVGAGLKYCSHNAYLSIHSKKADQVSIFKLGTIMTDNQGEWYQQTTQISIESINQTKWSNRDALEIIWKKDIKKESAVGDGDSVTTNSTERISLIFSANAQGLLNELKL